MEGKLIKLDEGYVLVDDKSNALGQTFGKFKGKKLSLKNCEDVANGYDLDKLACEWHKNEYGFMPQLQVIKAYISGYQKALEILGDKKFSVEELKEAVAETWNSCEDNEDNETFTQVFKRIIQSLKQTEWDCIVVMEENCPYDYTSRCTQGRCDCKKPKFDADGCLILKRK